MTSAKVPLMQINEREPQTIARSRLARFAQLPIWDLAFRPLFLLASAFSVISLLVWVATLNGFAIKLSSHYFPTLLWHVHEMIFGFALTVAMGFVLTAAQTWTGQRSLHGWGLILLTFCWLMARVGLWQAQGFWLLFGAIFQLIWWLIAIVSFARLVIKAGQRKQFILVVLLGVIALLNVAFLYCAQLGQIDLALHLARSAILCFSLVIGVLAGRVIPFFTRRGAAEPFVESVNAIKNTPKLDQATLMSGLFAAVTYLLSYFFALAILPAVLLLISGALHLYRLSGWKSLAILNKPLLWSLHLSYLALGIGLFALGLSYFFEPLRFSDALHIITLGAIGGLILAMMARVSLGHTGRPLISHWLMSCAFGLMLAAALTRFVFSLLQLHFWAWNLSAGLWVISFSFFVVIYWPVLSRARISS